MFDNGGLDDSWITELASGRGVQWQTTDYSLAGTYRVRTTFLINGVAMADPAPLEWAIIANDYCTTSVTLLYTAIIEDQIYVVGDDALSYFIPAFTISDNACASRATSSLSIDDPSVTQVTFNALTHEMTFLELENLDIVGGSSPPYTKSYVLTLTGVLGSQTVVE